MAKNKFGRFLRYFLGLLALRCFMLITVLLPLAFIYKISGFLARLVYCLAGRQRRTAREGLAIAFASELSLKAREDIAIASFEEGTKGIFETMVLLDRPQTLKQQITLSGREHIERALAKGKGVICVSAHFGNFPLLVARLKLAGFLTAVVVRHMRDEKMDQLFHKRRQEFGATSIYTKPAKVCVDQSLAFLKRNGVIVIQLDQNFGSGRGVFVNFFGRQAATATGPVVLALRSKAAIIPAFIIRKKDNTQDVVVQPEFLIEQQGDFEETVKHNIARITGIIEGYIRKYPAQWSWIHRRWKSRPSNKDTT